MAGVSDALLVAVIVGYVGTMLLYVVGLIVHTRVPAIAALVVMYVTIVLHVACVLTRALAAGRVPWGNMYEFILTSTLIAAIAYLVATRGRPAPAVGLFVALGLALLLGGAGRVHVRVAPLAPALQSPWLRVHVATAALATGLFLIGFISISLYLMRLRQDRSLLLTNLPPAPALERLAARMHAIGFPVWTFAIATGAIWAEAAWGRYWGWDPKETWAFISWVLYACHLHARSTAGWRGRRAALLACAAWASMLINVFAVNVLMKGLHSYAGF